MQSAGGTAFYSEPDVEAASVLSGRAVEVVRAVNYVPEGRQPASAAAAACGSCPASCSTSPRPRARRRAPSPSSTERNGTGRNGARRRAPRVGQLVGLGQPEPARPDMAKDGQGLAALGEARPLVLHALAVCVQGTAHLLLAVLERLVADRGGCIAYQDTDSSFIVSSADGGTLPDGRRVLPWGEVDEVLSAFEPFSLPGWPVWKAERGTAGALLHTIVFGPKRHMEFIEGAGGPELVGFTEANLGGQFMAPPDLPDRDDDDHYDWVRAVAEREVRFALDRERSPKSAYRPSLSWSPFPSLRRLPVTTPEVLAGLPKSLGRDRVPATWQRPRTTGATRRGGRP